MNPDLTVVPFVDPWSGRRLVSLRLVLVVGYIVGYKTYVFS